VISSNFGPISHRFRDTAIYSLKPSIESCGQTAADGNIWLLLTAYRGCQRPIRWYHRRPFTTYRL